MFHALEREGRRLNYDIVVFTTTGYYLTQNEYDIQEKNIFRFAAIDKLDGIIIVPESYEQEEFRELLYDMLHRHAQCPVVAIRHDGNEFDCVFTDESQAIRPLVRHLIERHGLKRICFQTGFPGHIEAQARLDAFRWEMADHGLTVPDADICPGTMWTDCAGVAWDAFFSNPNDRPEAVVCANDYMAVSLMRLLMEKGLRVPGDVVVTGFDNIPGVGPDMPGLTTIQPDYDQMVVQAMEHLDKRIRGVSQWHRQARFSLQGKLVLSESCGCGRRSPDYFREVSRRTELIRLYEERRMSSVTDLLTGLLNRRGFMERLEPIWHNLAGATVAFISIDMDRLKHINDNFGHAAGDFAIRLLARAIKAALPKDGIGARIGGDEFLIFLPSAGNGETDAFQSAFDGALQRLNAEENRSFTVSASAGCTTRRLTELDTIEGCIHDSDTRMYQIKETRHMTR